jgi:hypothetical protein
MTWALFVFLFIEGTGQSNPNIATINNVPGFQTLELCMDAGNKVVVETFIPETRRRQHRSYVCLRQQ